MMGYIFITISLPLILFCYFFRNKNGLPTNWPLVGMLPVFLKNLPRLNNFIIELMEKSRLTFLFDGPRFSEVHYLLSVDPANVNHVSSKNSGNYDKGTKLKEILDMLGNGILNTEGDLWLYHRKVALSFFNHPKFHHFLLNITLQKIDRDLIPILEHASKQEIVVDMKDIFLRFMYDSMCIIMLDHDLKSLSLDMPRFPLLTAVADLEHGVIYRHVLPTFIWKFLRWLNVGYERKMQNATRRLDNLIYKFIDQKREERKEKATKPQVESYENGVKTDLLTFFMDQVEKKGAPIRNDTFIRDTIINYFLAGAETTSTALTWFFCLLSQNPRVLQKIKDELQEVKNNNNVSIIKDFNGINNKLIYLHAALCETMRLYPSLVYNTRAPIESDVLPSGHPIKKNSEIIFNIYAMGRSKTIWGDDCCDFKPERWITDDGMIKHEPSYKFYVFGSGPRSCLGKQMALTQIKVIAANIIQHYQVEAMDKCHVPEVGMVLRMKSGFKVKVFRN